MQHLQRREFIKLGGGALGALAAALSAWPELAAAAQSAGTQLTAAQQATYGALVDAVALIPAQNVRSGERTRAQARFGAAYEQATDDVRRAIGATLDALEARPGALGFSRRSAQANAGLLADLLRARTPAERALDEQAAQIAYGHPSRQEGAVGLRRFLAARTAAVQDEQARLRAEGKDPHENDADSGLPRWTSQLPRDRVVPAPPDSRGTQPLNDRLLAGAALELAQVPFNPTVTSATA